MPTSSPRPKRTKHPLSTTPSSCPLPDAKFQSLESSLAKIMSHLIVSDTRNETRFKALEEKRAGIVTSSNDTSEGNAKEKRSPTKERSSPSSIRTSKVDQWDATLRDVDISGYQHLKLVIYKHFRLLTNRPTATTAFPPPLASAACDQIEQEFPTDASLPPLDSSTPFDPTSTFDLPIKYQDTIDQDYHQYLLSCLARWKLPRITWDFSANPRDRVNEIMLLFVEKTLVMAAKTGQYHNLSVTDLPPLSQPLIIRKILVHHIKSTIEPRERKAGKSEGSRKDAAAEDCMRQLRKRTMQEYYAYLCTTEMDPVLLAIFKDHTSHLMPNIFATRSPTGGDSVNCTVPDWWSSDLQDLMTEVERQVRMSVAMTSKRRGASRAPRLFLYDTLLSPTLINRIPLGLPTNLYDSFFLERLPPATLKQLSPARRVSVDDFVKDRQAGKALVDAFAAGTTKSSRQAPVERSTSQHSTGRNGRRAAQAPSVASIVDSDESMAEETEAEETEAEESSDNDGSGEEDGVDHVGMLLDESAFLYGQGETSEADADWEDEL